MHMIANHQLPVLAAFVSAINTGTQQFRKLHPTHNPLGIQLVLLGPQMTKMINQRDTGCSKK
jgi:hypothetical protein